MTALRSRLIRLAFQNPKLRPHLVPILKQGGPSGHPKPGFYRHFKGGRYKVLFTARYSEDESWMVVYLNGKGEPWVRPLAMWNEVTNRWPDGVSRPRFVPEREAHGIFE